MKLTNASLQHQFLSGLGIDILAVPRIIPLLESWDGLEDIFTPNEIELGKKRRNFEQFFAARFAGKEAVLKALGTGITGDIRLADVEILHDSLGRPIVHLHGKAQDVLRSLGYTQVQISLSHCKEYAAAIAILT